MKKLLLSLVALGLSALSFNINAAGTLYMMGSGEGLSWESFPGKTITPSSDGSYSVTIDNLVAFKLSTAQASNWDDFNAGAFGYSGTFGDAVYSTSGQTVALGEWGENQTMPATGSYTITINSALTSMTVKANFSKPTTATPVYLRGGMNGWGTGDAYQFSYDSSSSSYSWTGSISAGVEFKIADGSWGTINYGGSVTAFNTPISLTYNGSNIKLNSNFTGTITFKITGNNQATATFATEGGGEPSYPEKLYVIGTINGEGWNPTNVLPMTTDGKGVYTISSVTLAENGGSTGFAITGGGATWDDVNALRYGPSENDSKAVVGLNTDIATGDLSWSIEPGTYAMTFDLPNMSLKIELLSQDVTYPDNLYIIGTIDGNAWDPANVAEMNNEGDGIYTIENITLKPYNGNNGFAITGGGSSWEEINALRFGPAVQDTEAKEGENAVDGKGDLSWTIAAGIYNMTFDMSELVLDIELVESFETPITPGDETIYLLGAVNEWTPDDEYAFTKIEDGSYTLSLASLAGEFKVATSDWSTVNLGGDAQGQDVTAVNAVLGNNTLWQGSDVNLTAGSNWTNVVLSLTINGQTAVLNIKADVPVIEPGTTRVYVVGDGEGMTWDLPGTEYTGEDGVVTFTLTKVSMFKVADVSATEWDTFNAAAYFSTEEFTEAGVYPTGQTLSMGHIEDAGASNQKLPYMGNYEITLNFNAMTMTVKALTENEQDYSNLDIYIRGDMNSWEVSDDWKFTYNAQNDNYTFVCEGKTAISAEDGFKFADADWKLINFGYNDYNITPDTTVTLDYNGQNMYVGSFEGTITLNINSKGVATANFSTTTAVIDSIGADSADAVYFDLQGRKVANPDKGIYIKVVDGKAVKLVK